MSCTFANWLKDRAAFCEANNLTLIPLLTLVHQVYNGEYDRDASILQFKSVANTEHDAAVLLYKSITKYSGQELSYRKWVINQLPFPSPAHFEYLSFGRRLDKRTKWCALGLKKIGAVLKAVKNLPVKPTDEQYRKLFSGLEAKAGRSAATAAVSAIFAHVVHIEEGGQRFEFSKLEPNNWFSLQADSEEESSEEETCEPRNRRSAKNAARHNIERFARWIQTTSSPRVHQEIRQHWDNARFGFQQAVIELVGEQQIDLWLLQTDRGTVPAE